MEEDAWERRERSRQEEESENLEKAEVEAFMKMKQRGTSHPSIHQEHPSEELEPLKSPKTLTASGSCQQTSINMLREQDNIQVDVQEEDYFQPEGRGTSQPSIHQEHPSQESPMTENACGPSQDQVNLNMPKDGNEENVCF